MDLSWNRNQNLRTEIPFPKLRYCKMTGTNEFGAFLVKKDFEMKQTTKNSQSPINWQTWTFLDNTELQNPQTAKFLQM